VVDITKTSGALTAQLIALEQRVKSLENRTCSCKDQNGILQNLMARLSDLEKVHIKLKGFDCLSRIEEKLNRLLAVSVSVGGTHTRPTVSIDDAIAGDDLITRRRVAAQIRRRDSSGKFVKEKVINGECESD